MTHDEPRMMTEAQAHELEALSKQTGDEVPDGLTEAAAAEKINELRARAGQEHEAPAPNDDWAHDPQPNTPVGPNSNR